MVSEFDYFCRSKNLAMAKKTKEETIVNVQEVYTKTEMFLHNNRKPLLIGVSAVAVLFVGFFAYQYMVVNPKEEAASNAVWRAEQMIEIDSTDLAVNGTGDVDGLESIVANYSGTVAAKRAHYYLGTIARDNGDFENAITHFKETDFDDETISVLSLGNIGDCYVQLGNVEEGASWLEKAAVKAGKSAGRNFLGPYFILKASKAYIELNKADKAKSLLQQLTDNYDTKSQEYSEGAKLLAMLKAQG